MFSLTLGIYQDPVEDKVLWELSSIRVEYQYLWFFLVTNNNAELKNIFIVLLWFDHRLSLAEPTPPCFSIIILILILKTGATILFISSSLCSYSSSSSSLSRCFFALRTQSNIFCDIDIIKLNLHFWGLGYFINRSITHLSSLTWFALLSTFCEIF